ncbi:MAG: type VI secretion system baseplate subunit TssF [Epsilonproteobacteria bacterium]|nr:MAG: type VI secretion system baseplate subunit TssF [Campylobacterota bacterium]
MNDKSFEKYFQNELSNVRTLAKEFSNEHPAVAPLLSANSSDPDAQRLLEGVAFLTGLLNKKLDDEFPEVIHGLMNILFPHYLRPIPAISIVEFYPKPSLREMLKVNKGTIINSKPVDDVECRFTTMFDFKLYPIELKKSSYTLEENNKTSLTLDISSKNAELSSLNLNELNFYLSDSYTNSSNLFMLLEAYLENIYLEVDNGELIKLGSDALECDGFNTKNSLFSYPKNSFTGYRILQEYFVLPQKFFFFKLKGLEKLKKYQNLNNFRVVFRFKDSLVKMDSIAQDSIKLFCTPVNNLFDTQAEPVTLTHKKELIHIYPQLRYKDNYQVYDIKNITGYVQGEVGVKQYYPFESFQRENNNQNIYQVYRKISIVNAKEEIYIGLHYSDELPTKKEVLSIDISCTNGLTPERLQLGEICESSDNSPELATFKNIISPTMQIDSPVNENSLWQFISHLSVNLLTLADIKTFKEMLKLYMFANNRDKVKVAKNQKRIDAIDSFEIEPVDRVSRGYLLKGHKVRMKVRQDYFASLGDMYLFCSVILSFLSNYAALNTFVELEVEEKITGESLSWTPVLGNKKLI